MEQDTRELWLKRVERWKDSGLSAREFASEMGINPHTLSYWRWKLSKKTKAPATKAPAKKKQGGFVEVVASVAQPPSPAKEPLEPLEIVLRDELRIRVPVRFDPDALRRVVATLGTC